MILIYAKSTEDLAVFDDVLLSITSKGTEIRIFTENRKAFRILDEEIKKCSPDDILCVSSLSSLGLNNTDTANRLQHIVDGKKMTVICSYPSTYEYGVYQPLNGITLETVLQGILNENKNIIELPASKRSNSGRPKIQFPDNWEELYEKWEKKEISSGEFLTQSGLKKATFYNLMAEYRSILERNRIYIDSRFSA